MKIDQRAPSTFKHHVPASFHKQQWSHYLKVVFCLLALLSTQAKQHSVTVVFPPVAIAETNNSGAQMSKTLSLARTEMNKTLSLAKTEIADVVRNHSPELDLLAATMQCNFLFPNKPFDPNLDVSNHRFFEKYPSLHTPKTKKNLFKFFLKKLYEQPRTKKRAEYCLSAQKESFQASFLLGQHRKRISLTK